jgi:hypothetical protein
MYTGFARMVTIADIFIAGHDLISLPTNINLNYHYQ